MDGKKTTTKISLSIPAPVRQAMDLLGVAGYECYLVGGAVRDQLLCTMESEKCIEKDALTFQYKEQEDSGGDWDMTTSATPEEIKEVFASYRVIETGIKHGTVTVLMPLDGLNEGADTSNTPEEAEEAPARLPLEITTYRVDGEYKDRRHPEDVTFTRNLKEDLARRDYTVNAMAWSPLTFEEEKNREISPRGKGQEPSKTIPERTEKATKAQKEEITEGYLVDPFGGIEDLKEGIIRIVGDPNKRFQEDALRILRGLRFASRFGWKVEKTTAKAIHDNKQLLVNISVERIKAEMDGLLAGAQAGRILREFADVITVFIPELKPAIGFEQHSPYHHSDVWVHTTEVVNAAVPWMSMQSACSSGAAAQSTCSSEAALQGASLPKTPVVRWAALFHDIGKPDTFFLDEKGIGHFYGHDKQGAAVADQIMHRLKFDNRSRELITFLVERHMTQLLPEEKPIRRALRKYGEEKLRFLLQLRLAESVALGSVGFGAIYYFARMEYLIGRSKEEAPHVFSRADLPVNGHDMMALGAEGPCIKEVLAYLTEEVLEERIANDREALLEAAENYINKG